MDSKYGTAIHTKRLTMDCDTREVKHNDGYYTSLVCRDTGGDKDSPIEQDHAYQVLFLNS